MDLWQQLVKQALVGTARHSVELPPTGGQLGEVLRGLERATPEARLLGAAAAVALSRQVGRLPAHSGAIPVTHTERDDLSPCGPAASIRLERLLAGEYREVLPEWLTAASSAGVRIPDHLLPRLLEEARERRDLREHLLPVLGARGRWLAAQNPAWAYVGGSSSQASWHTGTRAERLTLLRNARREDPAGARAWVAATWREDAPEDLAAFLETFRTGLSLEDEPLLESALDHRRKEVRQVATDLLSRLARSQLVARMIERARPLLTLGAGTTPRLEITLPAACDKAMVRDGIDPKPLKSLGEKAGWLFRMLAVIPPGVWCLELGSSPEQLIGAAHGCEWERLLIDAWVEATLRHPDPDWALALMEDGLVLNPGSGLDRLAGIVPPAQLEPFILDHLAAGGVWAGNHPSRLLLRRLQQPWSETLSRAVLERLRAHISARGAESDWHLRTHLKEFALYLHPSIAQEAASGWTMTGQDRFVWGQIITEMVDLLQFRHDMLEELTR